MSNNWSLTLAFHIIFTRAPVNFMWAQARVCLGVAMPLKSTCAQEYMSCCWGKYCSTGLLHSGNSAKERCCREKNFSSLLTILPLDLRDFVLKSTLPTCICFFKLFFRQRGKPHQKIFLSKILKYL